MRYGEVGSAVALQMVEGDMNRRATISGLTPSTDYTVSVAAVNSAGTGVYSDEKVQRTEGEHCCSYHSVHPKFSVCHLVDC